MFTEAILPKPILVFLPVAVAQVIVTRLAERGHAAFAVSTVAEVFDALRSDGYCFAITTRPEIDLMRNIRSIPVVNLEIFFHAEASGEGPLLTSKRFDGKAFMERVEFLLRPTSKRSEYAGLEQANPAKIPERTTTRLWNTARNTLGLPRQREGLRNV